eukprot:380581_1
MALETTTNWPPAISIIDLSLDEPQVVRKLRSACIEVGFFYVVNHGIPQDLIDRTFSESKRFFDQPSEWKMKIMADENYRGYNAFEEETLDGANQSKGGTKEGFYIGREIPKDSPEAKQHLHGPNQWPENFPGWRKCMEEYYAAVQKVSNRLVELLALALECGKDHFRKSFERPIALLRLLHYSSERSVPGEGVFACGAHSDYGMLTVLATDSVPGLQVLRRSSGSDEGIWQDVDPVPGGFIVNLGDMLQQWSNDRFKSTIHRVVNRTGQDRYSIPFFYEPSFDTMVETLPSCVDPEHPVKYTPVMYGDHIMAKFHSSHALYAETSAKRTENAESDKH